MLIKFLPDQVAKHWEMLKGAINTALPKCANKEERSNNILELILLDNIVCWISVDADKKVNAVVTTMIEKDIIENTKRLLLFTVTNIGFISEKDWKDGLKTLATFAKGIKCKEIFFYTENISMIEKARELGASSVQRIVKIPV